MYVYTTHVPMHNNNIHTQYTHIKCKQVSIIRVVEQNNIIIYYLTLEHLNSAASIVSETLQHSHHWR